MNTCERKFKNPISNCGYLSCHLGPMQAGKTSFATSKATEYADIGADVLFINHSTDNRVTIGGEEGKFTSHSSSNVHLSEKIIVRRVSSLKNVNVSVYSVIIVDEAQFFDDLVETVRHWVKNLNKHVIVVGLDGDYKMEPIGSTLQLLPMADFYEKLSAKCTLCIDELSTNGFHGSFRLADGPFTARLQPRLSSSDDVGGMDKYISVCRYHHDQLTKILEEKESK